MMGHILVASSPPETRLELRSALEFDGHEVVEADSADQTIQQACSEMHDVLIVDSFMDGIAAYGLCRAIRPKSGLGIIVLGGESATSAIDALNAGADDFVPVPFVMAELLSRVRAILRRVPRPGRKEIVLPDGTIDLETRTIRRHDGRVSHLTPKEFLVLQSLVTPANKPRTHQSLAQTIWQRDGRGEVEYMRVVVKQLRRKLEPDPENPRYILTERSVGYRFYLPPMAGQRVEARQ
jgi:two-component system KDP operon response regulator KdpE